MSWTKTEISWDQDEFPSLFLGTERLLVVEMRFLGKKSESNLDNIFLGHQTDPS